VGTASELSVEGADVRTALSDLFLKEPGLRNHLIEEDGQIRPHVSVFVDAVEADLETHVEEGSEIRILHAVSGG
jgi:molybdopterin synthase sulfur carrier subunit